MITNILIAIICVVAFLTSFWAYRRGIQDGLALKDNKPIEPIKTPVQAFNEVKQAKEISKEEEIQVQFMNNLFGYTGEVQKEIEVIK